MIFLRLLATVAFVIAIFAALYDGYQSLQAGDVVITSAGEAWYSLHAGSLNVTQAAIERYTVPAIWDPGIITVLQWPLWLVFALIGIILALLARLFRR